MRSPAPYSASIIWTRKHPPKSGLRWNETRMLGLIMGKQRHSVEREQAHEICDPTSGQHSLAHHRRPTALCGCRCLHDTRDLDQAQRAPRLRNDCVTRRARARPRGRTLAYAPESNFEEQYSAGAKRSTENALPGPVAELHHFGRCTFHRLQHRPELLDLSARRLPHYATVVKFIRRSDRKGIEARSRLRASDQVLVKCLSAGRSIAARCGGIH